MLAHARVMFGIGADWVRPLTRGLLRDPSLRGFARAAEQARAGRRPAQAGETGGPDFAQEAQIGGGDEGNPPRSVQKRRCPAPDPQWPRDLLLTGATGFLGAHLLADLLGAAAARVWCLVRAGDAAHARQRIAAGAAVNFIYPYEELRAANVTAPAR